MPGVGDRVPAPAIVVDLGQLAGVALALLPGGRADHDEFGVHVDDVAADRGLFDVVGGGLVLVDVPALLRCRLAGTPAFVDLVEPVAPLPAAVQHVAALPLVLGEQSRSPAEWRMVRVSMNADPPRSWTADRSLTLARGVGYSRQVFGRGEDAAAPVDPRVAAAVVDVFVYVVVLSLFVEYFPQVVSETFTLSLLTAILLKGVLEVVVAVKNRVKARFRAASTPFGKVVAAFMLWLVLFGSKFVVLELIHLIFRDSVRLGGFFSVTLLIIVLMLSRAAMRKLLQSDAAAAGGSPRSSESSRART